MKTRLRKNNNKIIFPLILLLIYSALIPMQLSNYVLCFGEDGHIKLEITFDGCCMHELPDECEHTETDESEEEDHCGDCVDLPIFATINSEIYNVSTFDNPLITSDTTYVLPKLPKTPLPLNSNLDKPYNISPLINPTLISIRTVTLLI